MVSYNYLMASICECDLPNSTKKFLVYSSTPVYSKVLSNTNSFSRTNRTKLSDDADDCEYRLFDASDLLDTQIKSRSLRRNSVPGGVDWQRAIKSKR